MEITSVPASDEVIAYECQLHVDKCIADPAVQAYPYLRCPCPDECVVVIRCYLCEQVLTQIGTRGRWCQYADELRSGFVPEWWPRYEPSPPPS